MESDLLTVHEVAAYLRMNPMSVYRMAREGRIPASKILDCWRFRRSEIERWLSAKTSVPRFLLADGDREFLNLSAAVLKEAGIRCNIVSQSSAALKCLEHEEFSAAFVGIGLDDGSGWELIALIERNRPDLPVVLLADPAERDRIPSTREGCIVVDKFRNAKEWKDFLRLVRQ